MTPNTPLDVDDLPIDGFELIDSDAEQDPVNFCQVMTRVGHSAPGTAVQRDPVTACQVMTQAGHSASGTASDVCW